MTESPATRRNVENINKLIACLRRAQKKAPHRFKMTDWFSDTERPCKTAACLGGWCELLMQAEAKKPLTTDNYYSITWNDAVAWLGLGATESNLLFLLINERGWCLRSFDNLPDSTRCEIAIAHLTHIRDGGAVDWNLFLPNYNSD